MSQHGHCPNCGVSLDDGSIWEHFFKETGSAEEADRIATMYGAKREKGSFGRAIALYDRDQDRTVAWKCPDCEHVWSRDSVEKLLNDAGDYT